MRAIGVLQKIIVLSAALSICGVSYARNESSGQMQMRWQAEELAKDVAALKKGDRGMVPSSPDLRQFLNFRPMLKGEDDIFYCNLSPGEVVELVVRVGKDVVARVEEAKNLKGDCAHVLVTQEQFVPLKRTYDEFARKKAESEKRIKDTLGRLKAARDALAAEGR